MNYSSEDENLEWVLLVPPKLTQVVYEALVQCQCVSRPWELPGRTGTRIHRHSETQVGIPIAWMERLVSLIHHAGADDDDDDSPRSDDNKHQLYLSDIILHTPGVELIQKPFTASKSAKIYDEKPYDARIHPERARTTCVDERLTTPTDLTKYTIISPAFTYAELFAGIGGFGVALERLGGACIFCSELEESCRALYALNFPKTINLVGDILEVLDQDLPKPQTLDILVAGFPCQPFSSLGEQPGLTCPTKGNLFLQVVRVLKVSQPKAFLLENVPGLLSMTYDLEVILSALEEAGYDVTIEVCNARGLTATTRKRLYFVGLVKQTQQRAVSFEFPYIPDLGLRARDAISYQDCLENDSLRVTDDQFARLQRENHWRPNHLAWPSSVCATLVSHYGNAISQGNSQLVPCQSGNPRRFSPRECARLMGFPNSYQLFDRPRLHQGDMAFIKEQYRMLGNAVCPPVIAALAGAVLAHCETIAGFHNHKDWVAFGRTCAVELAMAATIPKT
jgi:DNA (cytosine-5)-methyltransferase 1